jgi:predicted N-acyltransferase
MLGRDSFYLTLWSGKEQKPVAGIPCYVTTDENAYVFYNVPRLLVDEEMIADACPSLPLEHSSRLAHLADKLCPSRSGLYPALVSVAPYGYISSICHRPDLAQCEIREATDHLLWAFDDLASEHGVMSKAFLYVPDQRNFFLADALTRRGYHTMALLGECLLPISWTSFEDYLATHTSSRRWAIRADIRNFERSGMTVHVEGPDALDDRLAQLQSNVQRKYGHRGNLDRIKLGYSRIKHYLAPQVRVFVARRGSDTVGFALFYELDDVYYCKQVGFDYQRLGNDACYFNVLFYEPIRQAISKGIQLIHYGSESYEAKMGRGCKLKTLSGYFHLGDQTSRELAECMTLQDTARRTQFEELNRRFSGKGALRE